VSPSEAGDGSVVETSPPVGPLGADASEVEGDLGALAEAIASSARPRAIDPDVHERILMRALGLDEDRASGAEERASDGAGSRSSKDAPGPAEEVASAEEITRAAALRRAFEAAAKTRDLDQLDGTEPPEVLRLVALARALRLAFAPATLDAMTSERLLRPALALPSKKANRGVIVGATTVLIALAAVFAGLWISSGSSSPSAKNLSASLPMAPVRSTDELFDPSTPFPREGGASERIDTIVGARQKDLRENRFASWGIR
jgi:hypothetical protein